MAFTFRIDSPVFVKDGEAGRLRFVVLDPQDREVTDLIVERGKLLQRSIVVPVSWVETVDEEGIRLNAELADLDTLPEYRELDFLQPITDDSEPGVYEPEDTRAWALAYGSFPLLAIPMLARHVRLGVDSDLVLVSRGTSVVTLDEQTVGKVDHVLVDPETLDVTHLVVHPRFNLGHDDDILIAIDQVASINTSGVRLELTREEFEQAPRYRQMATDAELKARIGRALETQPETRDQGVDVEVEGGLVRLLGDVPEAVAEAAHNLARRIRGVIGVEDRTKQTR